MTSFSFCLFFYHIFTGFSPGFFFQHTSNSYSILFKTDKLKKNNHESFPQSSRAGCFKIKVHLLYHSYVMGSQSVYLFCISLHIAALNQTALDHGKENTEALIQQ